MSTKRRRRNNCVWLPINTFELLLFFVVIMSMMYMYVTLFHTSTDRTSFVIFSVRDKHYWLSKYLSLSNDSTHLRVLDFRNELYGKEVGGVTYNDSRVSNSTNGFKKVTTTSTRRSILTLFTTWAEDKSKYVMHNSTVKNWLSFGPSVNVVMFTNESGLAKQCSKLGMIVLPVTHEAANGVPVLKHLYMQAEAKFNTKFYGFANGDILFTESLIHTLEAIDTSDFFKEKRSAPILIVGKRTNVNNVTSSEAASYETLSKIAISRGKLFPGYAEDYFITTKQYPWKHVADIVLGRAGYDNYLVAQARINNYHVIEATKTLLAVHQTTKAGNFESESHKHAKYNIQLLKRQHKDLVYESGYTNCTEYFTECHRDTEDIRLTERQKLPRYCRVNPKSSMKVT